MPIFCSACFYRRPLAVLGPGLSLCTVCRGELQDLQLPLRPRRLAGELLVDVLTLYRYQGLLRSLILRAKVQMDQRALLLLWTLAQERLGHGQLILWADVLIPSPASLWSRARGRLDIAATMADNCAQRFDRALMSAPWHLHWRWHKNARRRADERRGLGAGMPGAVVAWSERRFRRALARHGDAAGGVRLLLIDDVYTTGVTLRSLAAAVAEPGVTLIRGLTLTASNDEAAPS